MKIKGQLSVGLGLLAFAGCSSGEAATTTTTTAPATTTTVPATTTTTTTVPATTTTTTTVPATTTTTTTVPATTTTVPATVPDVVIPEGAPTRDEVWEIVSTWNVRVRDLYANPTGLDVDTICAAGSPCAERYTIQIDDIRDRGEHVEGADPITVNHLKAVSMTGDGGFSVNYWTNPNENPGRLVGPDRNIDIDKSPTGGGGTLIFTPFPDDPAFPWRVVDIVHDPT